MTSLLPGTDRQARVEGFSDGYQRQVATSARAGGPPPCPYPLRSTERQHWIVGWNEGLSLGWRHREEFHSRLQDMIDGED